MKHYFFSDVALLASSFQQLFQAIQTSFRRLLLKLGTTLLFADSVLLMYDMCRYDKAWNLHDRSAWCGAFSREELQVLEYGDDLKSFYESGYGNPLNVRLGCTPLKDMLERFTYVTFFLKKKPTHILVLTVLCKRPYMAKRDNVPGRSRVYICISGRLYQHKIY